MTATPMQDVPGATKGAPGPHPWDQAAAGWDRHREMLGEWLAAATAQMLDAAGIVPGARVLDVAAGAGDQTLQIAHRVHPGGQVLATDISARSLELAARALHRAGCTHVRTQVADAQALGLAGADFDAAVSRLGLMFCRAPLDALQGIRSALRPGGRVSALVFAGPAGNPCIATMVATAWRHAGGAPPSPFEPGSLLSLGQPGLLAALLEQAGFSQVDVRAVSAPMRLPSCHHYIDFVRTAGLPIMAILAPLPAAAQRAAWADIERQLDRFAGIDGWTGPNELLLASATVAPAGAGGAFARGGTACASDDRPFIDP
jgi:SAM-dependent methyltransferase